MQSRMCMRPAWAACAAPACPGSGAIPCLFLPPLLQVQLLDLSGKDPALRLRAANLLGLLIRHAASISPALAAAGASEALAAAMRQPQDPALQRRAAAALGELLFYADSQNRSGSSSGGREAGGGSGWDLSAEAVATLAAQLALGQDAVAQVS